MHTYFSQPGAHSKNEWTGYFQGKNLMIVAEGFVPWLWTRSASCAL